MKLNFEIIFNVFVAMVFYRMFFSWIGSFLLKYFLDKSETIQKEKKSFQEKLKEKIEQNEKEHL